MWNDVKWWIASCVRNGGVAWLFAIEWKWISGSISLPEADRMFVTFKCVLIPWIWILIPCTFVTAPCALLYTVSHLLHVWCFTLSQVQDLTGTREAWFYGYTVFCYKKTWDKTCILSCQLSSGLHERKNILRLKTFCLKGG